MVSLGVKVAARCLKIARQIYSVHCRGIFRQPSKVFRRRLLVGFLDNDIPAFVLTNIESQLAGPTSTAYPSSRVQSRKNAMRSSQHLVELQSENSSIVLGRTTWRPMSKHPSAGFTSEAILQHDKRSRGSTSHRGTVLQRAQLT